MSGYTTKVNPFAADDMADAMIRRYGVYTKNRYFEIEGDKILVERENPMGVVPIVEYTFDEDRMGAFEKVIPLLDALNQTACDRQDSIEQFVQSILVILNSDLKEDELQNLPPNAILLLKSAMEGTNADAKLLTQALD